MVLIMSYVPVFKAEKCCSKCKGLCCKHMGCHYSPTDFEDLSFEGLKKEIEKGKISIDWWETFDGPEYYLRARHKNARVIDPSWGGVCINLTETGCSLSFEERPLGGKAVRPDPNGYCKSYYTKEQCKNDWKKYKEVLKQLVEYFNL